jgi:urease accessory protein
VDSPRPAFRKVTMAVLLSEVGRRGRLDVTFVSRNGRTTIRDAYCEVPFKITRLHDSHASGLAHLIVMHCTAGLFGGDTTECDIHVEAGARVLITQQSATKVHPAAGKYAVQRTRISVQAGAELQMYLEPVIPFAGSRLRQSTVIDVHPGARLCYWEGLMAGRIERGEFWQFDEFSSETLVRLGRDLLYLDRFSLKPADHAPSAEWVMGNSRYLATGVCLGDDATEFADRLHALLPEAGIDTPASGLVVARVVARSGLPSFSRRLCVVGADR